MAAIINTSNEVPPFSNLLSYFRTRWYNANSKRKSDYLINREFVAARVLIKARKELIKSRDNDPIRFLELKNSPSLYFDLNIEKDLLDSSNSVKTIKTMLNDILKCEGLNFILSIHKTRKKSEIEIQISTKYLFIPHTPINTFFDEDFFNSDLKHK